MSAHRVKAAQGFTLVEILIVVVILGILAAIVIPQFTSASEDAKASSLVSQLQTIRSQLEIYQVQHDGSYPEFSGADADAHWDEMTNTSGDYGPYLQQPPRNPLTDSATVADAPGADVGWVWDSATNTMTASVDAGLADMFNENDISEY